MILYGYFHLPGTVISSKEGRLETLDITQAAYDLTMAGRQHAPAIDLTTQATEKKAEAL